MDVYGCEALYLNLKDTSTLDKLQSKLIKCIVGLGPSYRISPLLKALKLQPTSRIIDMNNIQLLNNVMRSNSAAKRFYLNNGQKIVFQSQIIEQSGKESML